MATHRRYQSKTHFPLPRALHQELIYFTRQYKDKIQEYNDIPEEAISSVRLDGMPKGSNISDPTERLAIRRITLGQDIEAIEDAFNSIPIEYREDVKKHILDDNHNWPEYADIRTWTTYQGRYLFKLAENLGKLPKEYLVN